MFSDDHTYDDIMNLPHHVSEKHPHMDLLDRAAQFSPFAALTGFESAIEETGRITETRAELNEDQREMLDVCFQKIRENPADRPDVVVTYFVQDKTKDGGKYVTVRGKIKKIDEYEKRLIFEDGTIVAMRDVTDIIEG